MKRVYFLSLFLIAGLFSCAQDADTTEVKSEKEIETTEVQPVNIDSLWQDLVFEKGGCLTGGQRVHDGHFGGEGCVMTSRRLNGGWLKFYRLPKKDLTEFLTSNIHDTTTTKIHTCPCMPAKAGEVAVYCLHKIYLSNWWDFKEFETYKTKETTDCLNSQQSWLWDIMIDEKQCLIMEEAWKRKLKPK